MAEQTIENAGFIHSRGMKFPKHPEIMQGKIRRLLRSNSYEAKETEAALRVVREGDVVVELGGGIGYMSTLVATKRAIKSVHVFEANPNLIPYIRSVHGANGVTNAGCHRRADTDHRHIDNIPYVDCNLVRTHGGVPQSCNAQADNGKHHYLEEKRQADG